MEQKKAKSTKLDIIQCGSKLFLEQGYSATTPRVLCDMLDISTGHLTYYFPTKEHLLVEVVQLLCSFQRKMMEQESKNDPDPIMAVCIELIAMLSMCEQVPPAREFFLAAYTSPMCLRIIRSNDAQRAQTVFGSYCPTWTPEQFQTTQLVVSGIEYGILTSAGNSVPTTARIEVALDSILSLYQVPADIRKTRISQALATTHQGIGLRVMQEFRKYVDQMNKKAINEHLRSAR